MTPEGIPFFYESVKLYEDLSQDLGYNLLFSQTGRLELAHTESSVYALRLRAEANAALGVDSKIIGTDDIRELVPVLDMREGNDLPVMAGLYHPPAGVIRHDAVIWAYAVPPTVGAQRFTPLRDNRHQPEQWPVTGVNTNRGPIQADLVINCTAAWSSTIAAMVGLDLPMITHPLQAMVTEPLKPILSLGVSSTNFHVYVYQTDRGELVMGGAVDHYTSYSQKSTFPMMEELSAGALRMFPFLKDVNILRQWTGICDMTPDYAPIMGRSRGWTDSCSTAAGAPTDSRPLPSQAS